MAEEDDVDIVGVFNDDIVQSGGSFGVDDMGLNINELLPLLGSHNWLLSADQVWNLENPVDERSRALLDNNQEKDIVLSSTSVAAQKVTNVASASSHKKPWTDSEKDCFVKGLDIYGKSWSRISKFIKTRTTLQVKNFARQFFKHQVQQVSLGSGSPPGDVSMVNRLYKVDGDPGELLKSSSSASDARNAANVISRNRTVTKAAHLQKGGPILLPNKTVVGNEVIVRINKENSASESEDIDIEDFDDSPCPDSGEPSDAPRGNISVSSVVTNCASVVGVKEESEDVNGAEFSLSSGTEIEGNFDEPMANEEDLKDVAGGWSAAPTDCRLFYLDIPQAERTVARDQITDEERSVHSEFFEGRQQKTPERYLRIRNHILDAWESRWRPDYLNKTSVRQGLRNCGDVNCIGRIHCYLEQTGAINFGCPQTVYVRPFALAVKVPRASKKTADMQCFGFRHPFLRKELSRPRKRNAPVLRYDSNAGGFTFEHDEDGRIVDVAEGADPPPSQPKRARPVGNPFRLIKCAEFTQENRVPFGVSVCLSALVVMDVHAHLSSLEVIGLLGGHFYPETAELQILSAEPCESLSTGSECEMDPVSQTLASERLQQSGQSVIGWYHSHPSFAPNPSVRDIETQTKFQEWFGAGGAPFLGVIVSPDLPSMPFAKIRYLVVGDEPAEPGAQFRRPYRLPTSTVPFESDVAELVARVAGVVEAYTSSVSKAPLTLLNKLLASVQHHANQALVNRASATTLLGEIGRMLVSALTDKELEV